MGTAAHAEARAYLLQEMRQLGLNPQVQEATAVNEAGKVLYVGYVYNLIGRLEGTGAGDKAILLVAHYDSQPNARGAGDDGAGVAAILETVRALKQAEPLARIAPKEHHRAERARQGAQDVDDGGHVHSSLSLSFRNLTASAKLWMLSCGLDMISVMIRSRLTP